MGSGYASTLGSVFVGVLVTIYLHGIATAQYASYYASEASNNDPLWVRLTVFTLFIGDNFHTIAIAYLGWIYLIDGYSNPARVLEIAWPLPMSANIMALTAFIVQLFLSYRIYLFTDRNKRLLAFLVPLCIANCCLGQGVAVKVWQADSIAQLRSAHGFLTAFLSLQVATDILLAGCLIYILHERKSAAFRASERALNRLMKISLQTGLCTAIFALMCLVLWLALPKTQYYMIFGIPISRVYTCTLMDTLLSRRHLRNILQSSGNVVGSSYWMGLTINLRPCAIDRCWHFWTSRQ
ncbi:hypothetical protein CC2G_012465 [Coprinopsis cinerea AmutBmut pab1-1]|nr:hypothetical protein CC2G_012465 [Coprinopsis cinerea AmutBmut pab1-1]